MYEKTAAVFLYCVSPVHMGAGSATGVIDSPIQRECHTHHPSFAGSGIKGAVRHGFEQLGGDIAKIDAIFGPSNGEEHRAGAVSFGDAQLVLFPVRAARQGFVYATCAQALARAARLLRLTGTDPGWNIPQVADGHCRLPAAGTEELLDNDALNLEVFQYQAEQDATVGTVADWLAEHALPPGIAYQYFRDKLRRHLVVLSDTDFGYFARNATLVEPHVRINENGTAADGGLFYTENLPPESLLIAPLMASAERRDNPTMDAAAVMGHMRTALHESLVQLGGDATTGRGLVTVNLVEG